EDLAPNAAGIAEGPTYISVGQYALWFLPTRGAGAVLPAAAEDAWEDLGARARPRGGRAAPARRSRRGRDPLGDPPHRIRGPPGQGGAPRLRRAPRARRARGALD